MNSVLPSHGMRSLPIKQVATHSAELKSFLFEQTFEAEPGQFVMLWIPGLDEKPFSVSDVRTAKSKSPPKTVGPFSRALMSAGRATGWGCAGRSGGGSVRAGAGWW
jgi:dihydroorotate dehydrogenase electron transfer subunit